MKRILLINNYDSFVYNVKQLLDESGLAETTVVLNDQLKGLDFNLFDKIVISPGPGIPSEAGTIKEVIKKHKKTPMLGICLGFQAIGEVFGAKLYALPTIYHGHQSEVFVTNPPASIFRGISSPFKAGRYHSWALEKSSLPDSLEITSETEEGIIMSFKHKQLPVTGVLFHPESIMTPEGKTMIKNWLSE
jgi:anthranilate synthase/aminodeoxychorismate synthase-like glutamine amidotransferase